MRRLGALRGGVLAMVVLLVVPVAGAGTASAYVAEERPPKVGRKNLPTQAAVARLYPVVDGGERYITQGSRGLAAHAYEDCVRYTWMAGADRGTTANYRTALQGTSAYDGTPEADRPAIGGYRFTSVAEAEAAMDLFEEYVERCVGPHGGEEGHTTDLTPLEDPDLGDEAIAFRLDVSWPRTQASDADDHEGYQQLRGLVREGLSISIVTVNRTVGDPDPEPFVALLEVATRRLR